MIHHLVLHCKLHKSKNMVISIVCPLPIAIGMRLKNFGCSCRDYKMLVQFVCSSDASSTIDHHGCITTEIRLMLATRGSNSTTTNTG